MKFVRIFLFSCAALLLTGQSLVQGQSESWYEGKTIKVIVGFTSGGFYDRWSRLLARYVPKYLPGTPEMIVQNMPGAGGLIAACKRFSRTWLLSIPTSITLLPVPLA